MNETDGKIFNLDDAFDVEIVDIIKTFKTVPCPNCNHRFANIYSLKRHMLNSHLCISSSTQGKMNESKKRKEPPLETPQPHEQLGNDLKDALAFLKECKLKGFTEQKIA